MLFAFLPENLINKLALAHAGIMLYIQTVTHLADLVFTLA